MALAQKTLVGKQLHDRGELGNRILTYGGHLCCVGLGVGRLDLHRKEEDTLMYKF